MSPDSARAAFWDWSVAVYAAPEVRGACLELQDRHGIDVNLLLLGCWLAREGRVLPAARAAALLELAAGWGEDAVLPLRRARRALDRRLATDPAPDLRAFRSRLGRLELEAERLAQAMLAQWASDLPSAPGSAAARAGANLAALKIARADTAATLALLLPRLLANAGEITP